MHIVFLHHVYPQVLEKCIVKVNLLFTVLHEMQTRSSDENSVCPSVCLSVCPSHA